MKYLSMAFILLSAVAFAGKVQFTEIDGGSLGTVYKISKDGQTLSKLWAKNELAKSYPASANSPAGSRTGIVALDPENPTLISKQSLARKACLELDADLPTAQDYKDLLDMVSDQFEILNQKFPGVDETYNFFWTSSVHVGVNDEAWLFDKRDDYVVGYPYDLINASRISPHKVRCVLDL